MANKNIIQWNCRGIRPNFNELKILTDHYDPILFCLQETFLNNNTFTFKGFCTYHHLSRDIGGRACGGVSLLIKDSIPHSKVTLVTTLQAKAITISVPSVITICSLYLSPSVAIDIASINSLVGQLPKPFILLGDFNAHNTMWGSSANNGRGNTIENFILNNNLCLLNNGSHTYLHPGSGTFSAISLSLCVPCLYGSQLYSGIRYLW